MNLMSHPKCDKSWTGLKREHCSVCCETFSSTTAGDKHRVGNWIDSENPRRCADPESVGLVNRNGIWGCSGERPQEDF